MPHHDVPGAGSVAAEVKIMDGDATGSPLMLHSHRDIGTGGGGGGGGITVDDMDRLWEIEQSDACKKAVISMRGIIPPSIFKVTSKDTLAEMGVPAVSCLPFQSEAWRTSAFT